MTFMSRGSGAGRGSRANEEEQRVDFSWEEEPTERVTQFYSLKDIFLAILFLALIIGGTLFLKSVYGYEMTVFDPIADLKEAMKSIESFYALVTLIFFTLSCIWYYDPQKVHKCVVLALIFSCLMTTSLFVAKTYLDSTYTLSAFLEMYDNPDYRPFIGNITSSEFAEASLEGFENFSLRNKINIFINIFVIILEIYFFTKTNKIMEKQEKIRQYDEALFDDEINVKI